MSNKSKKSWLDNPYYNKANKRFQLPILKRIAYWELHWDIYEPRFTIALVVSSALFTLFFSLVATQAGGVEMTPYWGVMMGLSFWATVFIIWMLIRNTGKTTINRKLTDIDKKLEGVDTNIKNLTTSIQSLVEEIRKDRDERNKPKQ